MNKYFAPFVLILGFQLSCIAQTSNEIFTIYLVRHSEKDTAATNPALTSCGVQRSESLCNFLKDVQLDAVYSTDYKRTQSTALPTATSKGLEIVKYDADNLESFSKLLLEKKQDVLVVGHSNTTGVLAGLLIGEEIGEFDVSIYDRIYQVIICNNAGRLQILYSAFVCKE